jgi:putative hemolysin
MAKDLAALAWERELIVLADLLRPVHFVPEAARAVDVLRALQLRRTQLAVVVDEHGGMAGLLTLEDLVEELVGEIVGEAEEPQDAFQREADGSALVRGDAPIREVNRALGLDLPEGSDYTTVGGLCVALAGALPERGARLRTSDGTELEVLEASPRLVRRLRIRPPPRPPPP